MAGEAKIDSGALTRLLRAPGGIVGRDLVRRADLVTASAIAGCPRRSGHTASTIRRDRAPHVLPNGLGIYVRAGGAAIFIVKGTRPHTIRPRTRTILRFEVGGDVVWAKEVHHPGTRANNFMAEALRAGV